MTNFVSRIKESLVEWKEETFDQSNGSFAYYIKGRAVLHGLPVTVLTATAAGFLFQAAIPKIAAIYGAVNYVALTVISESIHMMFKDGLDIYKFAVAAILSSAISTAFISTICKTNLTYQAIIVLSIASLAGHVIRNQFVDPTIELS